jgi:hypothetical protein
MKLDRGDVLGFLIGVTTSVIATIIWDKYKEHQKKLEFGEKKIIEEMKSEIQGLKMHINSIKNT